MNYASGGIGLRSGLVLVAAILVSASVLFAASPYGFGGARTTTITRTTTSTVTTSSIQVQLHKVTFNETGGCSPPSGFYYERWYVTLDNITIVQPSNVTLSQINNQTEGRTGSAYKMISTIVFTVPDGNYSYYSSIGGGQGGGFQGAVTVYGSDKVVTIYTGPFCP